MDQIIKKLKSVELKLKSKAWFKKDKWIVSVHGFPKTKPQFITFHVFKKNWFNEDSQGIHIESFLAIDPKKRKKSSITIHVLHHAKIPGTNLKRTLIAEPFVDAIFDEVKKWDGYKFRAGKYGTQPFTKNLDGSSANFEDELFFETERMCKYLGPHVDNAIKQALK
jgi:hypothetical protein